MDFKGKYSISATPDRVFAALHDPEILAAAIPGCESVERASETDYRARTMIKIGPVKLGRDGFHNTFSDHSVVLPVRPIWLFPISIF